MTDPVDFVVKKLHYDLSSHGGLALVGRLFKRINLAAMIDPKYPVQTERGGIANSDFPLVLHGPADPGQERCRGRRGLSLPALCAPGAGPARRAIERHAASAL
jgi:hypothetical protein